MVRLGDRRVRRWGRAGTAAVCMAVVVSLTAGASIAWRSQNVRVPLLSRTLALTADGRLTVIAPDDTRSLLPGSRVLASSDQAVAAEARAEEQRQWLATGTIPGDDGPFGPMVRDALLDLHTMTAPSGAVVAGGASNWRYVWPRDAAFVAVAYAHTGHTDDALQVLDFVAGLQSSDGSFQARYRPDGSGPPDDRGIQDDGPGWVLWAAGQVQAALPTTTTLPLAVLTMADRSVARILALTGDGTRLPPPSSDYWEQDEHTVTLGAVAPMLAGLEAAAPLYRRLGQGQQAYRIAGPAAALRAVVESRFGPGYPRHLDGRSVDAALTMTMPPFQPTALAGTDRVWPQAVAAMRRPAGGLAPGQSWKNDGISWTPETALFALAAAATGRADEARDWLQWLSVHRTSAGSLPEKVLSNGAPAAVAPLAWTAALVVLAVDALGGGTDLASRSAS